MILEKSGTERLCDQDPFVCMFDEVMTLKDPFQIVHRSLVVKTELLEK